MYLDADERKGFDEGKPRFGRPDVQLDFDPRIIGNEIPGRHEKRWASAHGIRQHESRRISAVFNVLKGDMIVVARGRRRWTDKYELHHRAPAWR